MSNMNFNCDVCGREVLGCTFVNGMKFCSKCYQETFGETKKDRKIADLEAKLAESEKENKTLKDIRTLERVVPRNAQLHKLSNRDCYLKGFENAISETIRTFEETYGKEKCKLIEERNKYLMDIVKVGGYEYQIEELKQKLAEKEQEIESLRENSLSKRIFKEKLIPSHCMEQYEKYEQEIDKLTQYKISFAIAELEKVKEFCNNPKNIVEYEYCPNAWTYAVDKDKLMLEIDNQIKELKGE